MKIKLTFDFNICDEFCFLFGGIHVFIFGIIKQMCRLKLTFNCQNYLVKFKFKTFTQKIKKFVDHAGQKYFDFKN